MLKTFLLEEKGVTGSLKSQEEMASEIEVVLEADVEENRGNEEV